MADGLVHCVEKGGWYPTICKPEKESNYVHINQIISTHIIDSFITNLQLGLEIALFFTFDHFNAVVRTKI